MHLFIYLFPPASASISWLPKENEGREEAELAPGSGWRGLRLGKEKKKKILPALPQKWQGQEGEKRWGRGVNGMKHVTELQDTQHLAQLSCRY